MYSVIIPAKNEAKNIKRCIRSVFNCIQDFSLVEIVVVDNGSEDETVDIARREGAKVFSRPDATVASLRNYGVSKANYDLIAFIDADCEATNGWLENARKILQDQSIGVVGDYYLLPGNPSWVEEAFHNSTPRKRREVPYLSGGNIIMRKEVFTDVGGFDEAAITGEDYILCQKVRSAGYKIVADPSVGVIHHGNPKTLLGVFRREVWCGLGMVDLLRYGKFTLPLAWSIANLVLTLAIIINVALKWYALAVCLFMIFLLMPCGASLHRCYRHSTYNDFFKLCAYFMSYGLGRTVSLIRIFQIRLRAKHFIS